MSDITFNCPHCGKHLAVEDHGAGMTVPCPTCRKPLSIPTRGAYPRIHALTVKAEKGDARAQFDLGVCYDEGQGVPEDEVVAARWYRKAAEQNLDVAQFNLALCYASGEGVSKDCVKGCKWANLAAAQRNEKAKKFRDLLEEKMTPAQIAEGRRLAREFKPKRAIVHGRFDDVNKLCLFWGIVFFAIGCVGGIATGISTFCMSGGFHGFEHVNATGMGMFSGLSMVASAYLLTKSKERGTGA
ncbi:MAG: tetratricopeptide repeat protein [Verrucomicrobia bacterium]|nr:tetratricopeptide repeat protein [Verrucomicrobiota bacterium]